jgi:uroporphyrinogen-III synthase
VSSFPLAGRRVLVTRALHQAGKLSDGLRALGAEAVEVPVLEICPPVSFGPLDAAIRQFNQYDWVIFTSANTVHSLVERVAASGVVLGSMAGLKVAAVGESTAAAARDEGFQVTFVPVKYVAEGLIEGWPGELSGQRILLARAAIARDVLPDALREAGARVDVVDAYRNVLPEAAPELVKRAMSEGLDAATFTSSSSVTHLAEAAQLAGIAWPFSGVPAVSIGPITSQTLRELGWEPAVEANPSDIPGLVVAVALALSGSPQFQR